MATPNAPATHEHISPPVEIDLDDVPVPLTLARALGLQAELYMRLSTSQFQSVLKEHKQKFGESSAEYRKLRQLLVLGVQREVLPKYGYQGTLEGVAKLVEDLKVFADDPLVRSNTEVINHLIGLSPDDPEWIGAHSEEVSRLDRLTHEVAPHGELEEEERRAASPRLPPADQWQPLAGAGLPDAAATQGVSIGVELDLSDIQVPLTRERVLSLQAELLEGFKAQDFQHRLRSLEVEYAKSGGPHNPEFRRARQQLALTVQAKVLPKYGFEGTLEGVAHMVKEVEERFGSDREVRSNIEAIDTLLLEERAGSTSPPQLASPRRPEGPSPGSSPRTSPRWQTRKKYVTEKDGYWIVVGGKKHGGIRVRLAEDVNSHAWQELLAPGAIIKEVQRGLGMNDRLLYDKVVGDGPNYGWVSIKVKDHELLKRYRGEVLDLPV